MLNTRKFTYRMYHHGQHLALRQQGVILIVALVVLVALTLAGLSLMRSMDTSNLIAGNLAFQQAATQAAGLGEEEAVSWLQQNVSSQALCPDGTDHDTLECDHLENGYYASRSDPAAGSSWDDFWNGLGSNVVALTENSETSNQVSYVIHRLCDTTGKREEAGCESSPSKTRDDSSKSAGGPVVTLDFTQIYYRVTVRVQGPRNTVSYVQSVVAM